LELTKNHLKRVTQKTNNHPKKVTKNYLVLVVVPNIVDFCLDPEGDDPNDFSDGRFFITNWRTKCQILQVMTSDRIRDLKSELKM